MLGVAPLVLLVFEKLVGDFAKRRLLGQRSPFCLAHFDRIAPGSQYLTVFVPFSTRLGETDT